MLSYIIKNILRQKDKLALLIIGALLISSGLSILVGLSETNKGTIIHTLEEKWRTSYDIVVRPDAADEEAANDLLDPNYLSGLSGGISIEEWEKIKGIEGVSVAAPISMIGYASYATKFQEVFLQEPGIYKFTYSMVESDGIKDYKQDYTSFYTVGYVVPNEYHEYGLINYQKQLGLTLYNSSNVLIAAIDPDEESRLVGLDKAVIKDGESAYLKPDAPVSTSINPEMGFKQINLPILLSNRSYANQKYVYTISKLDLDFQNNTEAEKTIQEIVENGGEKYLETVAASNKRTYKFTTKDNHKQLMENISFGNNYGIDSLESLLQEKPSPLLYRKVESPFENQWSLTYEIKTEKHVTDEFLAFYNLYRKPEFYAKDMLMIDVPRIVPNLVGFYDPSKLNLTMDPTNELPMETYRLPTAKYVLDEKGNPVNPPKNVTATSNPFGYIMQPPVMLTTINGAKEIMGDKPISAIRIKVEGVSQLSQDSQKKLEEVAEKIETLTGLKADITLGSSPQPVLIHIPETNKESKLGWIEQPWIKKGTTINIFNETKLGYSGLVACLIIVAVMYVFAVNLVSYLSRKKEFAILKALGWKNTKIQSLMILESVFVGFMVALFTMIVLLIIRAYNPGTLSLYKLLVVSGGILFIYLMGALLPSLFVKKNPPCGSHERRGNQSLKSKDCSG
ncbi:ABC transporter permease [Siminovitchia terrae]|uniref:ABC transporter permease n=1 Tax=Siminovitchia terrae TaxID=1914933 RepID=A0A429X142_SIMTE|nr:ABC transporter permease [Siminovitchia terrae]RST56935.1 ABC transporter permease [Siminovitchia terrae]